VSLSLRLAAAGFLAALALGLWGPARAAAEFYGDVTTKRYHTAECPETPLIKKKNLKMFDAEAEARAKAFYPCPLCSAPVRKDDAVVASHRVLSRAVSRGEGYVVDKGSKTYHQAWCPLLKKLDARQMLKVADIDKALVGGNAPCTVCNPPVAFVRAVTQTGSQDKAAPAPTAAPGAKSGDKDTE
jgi:hypothetical protein